MIKRKEQWINYGKSIRKDLFFYEDKVLDLTSFMNKHPGGKKAIANYVYKDITDILFTVYHHRREQTLSTLLSLVVGRIPPAEMKQNTRIDRQITPTKEKKKVCFIKNYISKEKEEGAATEIEDSWRDKQDVKKSSKKGKNSKSKSKSKEKIENSKGSNRSLTSGSSKQVIPPVDTHGSFQDLDEEKPAFRVPILNVRRMDELTVLFGP